MSPRLVPRGLFFTAAGICMHTLRFFDTQSLYLALLCAN